MARERIKLDPKRVRSAALPVVTLAEAAFVEEVGLTYEGFGLPRMAGRIMGWLLICDPPYQSLTQLGKVLQASKGSISTMSRVLLQIGLVKRQTLPGDRRDYLVIPVGFLSSMMDSQTQKTALVRRLAEHGLKLLEKASTDRQARLREMHDLYGFFEREMPALLARWQREKKRT